MIRNRNTSGKKEREKKMQIPSCICKRRKRERVKNSKRLRQTQKRSQRRRQIVSKEAKWEEISEEENGHKAKE